MLTVSLIFDNPDGSQMSVSYCVPGSGLVKCGDGSSRPADQVQIGQWVYDIHGAIRQVSNKTVEVH